MLIDEFSVYVIVMGKTVSKILSRGCAESVEEARYYFQVI